MEEILKTGNSAEHIDEKEIDRIDLSDQDEADRSKALLLRVAEEELTRILSGGLAMDVLGFHHKYAPGLGHRKLGRLYLRIYKSLQVKPNGKRRPTQKIR